MKLHIHIERLVLDGLPLTGSQGAQLQEALQRELASALATGGLSHELRRGGAVQRLRAADPKLRDNSPGELGRQIARSVHGVIGRAK